MHFLFYALTANPKRFLIIVAIESSGVPRRVTEFQNQMQKIILDKTLLAFFVDIYDNYCTYILIHYTV